jgi:3-hydroxyisobutyrate dehydrogenase-like beta-hydroxyacid dehydrogenase
MKVGFIGLGKMGTAMAGRLLAAGHDLGVYNRTQSKAADLVNQGAKSLGSPAEAAAFGAIVITMLENDAALSAIVEGEGGLLSAMPKGAIHIAMGTHSVAIVSRLAEAHASAGIRFVCAPVIGRPAAAEAAQLGIIAGGEPDVVAACQPLFDAMGRRTYDGGTDPVSAAVAKIVNNMILACAIEALGEGFALGRRHGLPENSLYEILTDGVFSSPVYKIYGKIIADRDYFSSAGFSATTGLKDVMLALAAGEKVSMPLPSANVCRDRLMGAIANGHGNADWSVMAHEQARAGGLDNSD